MCTISTHYTRSEQHARSIVGEMNVCVRGTGWPTNLLGFHFDYPVLSPSEMWNEEAVAEYNNFVSNLSYVCKHISQTHDESRQRVYAQDIVGRLVANLNTFGCRSSDLSLTVVLLSLPEVLFGLSYLFTPDQIAFLWLKLAEISDGSGQAALLSHKMLQNLMESTHVDLREHALDVDINLERCFGELSINT